MTKFRIFELGQVHNITSKLLIYNRSVKQILKEKIYHVTTDRSTMFEAAMQINLKNNIHSISTLINYNAHFQYIQNIHISV